MLTFGAGGLLLLVGVAILATLNSQGDLLKGQLDRKLMLPSVGNDCLALNQAYYEKGASDQLVEVISRHCGDVGASSVVIPQKMTEMNFEVTLSNAKLSSIGLMKNGKLLTVGTKPGTLQFLPSDLVTMNTSQKFYVGFKFNGQVKFNSSDVYQLVGNFTDLSGYNILYSDFNKYFLGTSANVANMNDLGTTERYYFDSLR